MAQESNPQAQPSDPQSVNRRTLLKTAAAASAVAAGWPRSRVYALAPPRVIGANDRIGIGHIGVGGMGTGHVRMIRNQREALNLVQVAVCDIYKPRLQHAQQQAGITSDGGALHDYRKLLEMREVDAVIIASPEHWHMDHTIDALEAGKHVYLEKPMTRYAEEAFRIYDVAKKTGLKVQVGSQGCSNQKWHRIGQLVAEGKLGKLLWAQGGYCRQNPEGEWNYGIDEGANPNNLDWQAFLGRAPKREFDRERYFRWRKYWDYSAGIVTDLFPHVFHPLMLATGLAWPRRVVSVGGRYVERSKRDRDVADTVHILAEFENEFTIVLAGCTENERSLTETIRGNKATIESALFSGDFKLIPERPYTDEIDPLQENAGTGESQEVHERNWIECIRNGKEPNCNIELATRVMVTVGMAEQAYRFNKCMMFDPATRKITAG
jgi:predicted dehydrogenase